MDSIRIELGLIDYLILLTYFGFVLGIGFFLRHRANSSEEYLMSGRSIPAWIAGLAFLSANLGAQEVMGMAASGAKYGIATSHFYWVGAVPAMVFVGVFMMPFYYGSRARSVPEYLKLRFDEKTRGFNAVTFAGMTIFSSGISLYAMGLLLSSLLGWNFDVAVALAALIVLVYVFLGGLTSAIYNEVLQFFLIVAGFFPLVWVGLRNVGGWEGLKAKLELAATAKGYVPGAYTQAWAQMSTPSANPMGIEWFGMAMGLGFVLSFGYWCTDFLVVQRAMAADSMSAARRTPLIAAVPKMLFPFLVILPGMIVLALSTDASSGVALPMKADGTPNYDLSIPLLLQAYFPTGMLGLGLTALLASFMSGMAGNVTAFNTVWTYDIYQSYLRPGESDAHYLRVGKLTTVFGILASWLAAYLAMSFNNIMDFLQLIFAFVNAPLFATFLLGMFWARTSASGAFYGLVCGTAAAALHHGLSVPAGAAAGIKGGWLGAVTTYPSEMAQNFWTAIYAWTTCFAVTAALSMITAPKPAAELRGLVYSLTPREQGDRGTNWLAAAVIAGVFVLNLIFW